MSKPYTETDLSDQFDSDLNWRRKELSDLKLAIKVADKIARPALLRALVAMTYAHWEGYVKFCAEKYFQHLTLRRWPFTALSRQFYVNSFLARLDALFQTRNSIAARCKLLNEILDNRDLRFSSINSDLIDTRSNLSTDVVQDICLICAVDGKHFADNRFLIDQIILKRRNSIAHGQWETVDESDADDLVSNALALMSHFRTLLENKVYEKTYLAA
jgi:hypothetical protein